MTNAEILRVIGRNVRDARLRLNMTQECLAELVGVHWQTLSYIERGKYPFSVTTFVRLVQYLRTSSNRLTEGMGKADERHFGRVTKALGRKRSARRPRQEPIAQA